jgi:hypothetical protein
MSRRFHSPKDTLVGRCPTCGRRLPGGSTTKPVRFLTDCPPDEVDELAAEMAISDLSQLLGVPRRKLESYCRCLGIAVQCSEKEQP